MSELAPLRYWNRRAQREEVERVFHADTLHTLYYTRVGRLATELLLSRALFNQLYGYAQDRPASRGKIPGFVQRYGVQMEDFEDRPFQSFNDFFSRKLRHGARTFASDPSAMPAFSEARYLAFAEHSASVELPLKGSRVDVYSLLGERFPSGAPWAATFAGGPVLVARLCPVDYHRFHFPDDGELLDHYRIGGALHSVNPAALAVRKDILWTNERHVSILRTRHFGLLAMIEIGAITVGRIVQTHGAGPFHRGAEKGYFQFGGSSIVLVGERGRWCPDDDLLAHTEEGLETLVRVGDRVASLF